MDAVLRTAPSSAIFGSLRFSGKAHFEGGDFVCLATVEAGRDTFEVELQMIDPYRRDMLGFFEEIGEMARQGWAGVESWESEFAELHIDATSTGNGEVRLNLLIRWPPAYTERWEGTLVVKAEAVENFVERMRKLLRLEKGSRFRPCLAARSRRCRLRQYGMTPEPRRTLWA